MTQRNYIMGTINELYSMGLITSSEYDAIAKRAMKKLGYTWNIKDYK